MEEESTEATARSGPDVTVGVVGICSGAHTARCLDALHSQRGAPEFDVLVVHDPAIPGMESARERFPDVRFVSHEDQRTPLELASRIAELAEGELILLTEDHCIPSENWIGSLTAAVRPDRGAVGGVVETAPDASSLDWAFYFVDFFRYAPPARRGPSPSLTVCNVAYPREHLAAIRSVWRGIFHETVVNGALRERFGPLWLEPSARVTMRRRVGLRDALRERYAFGRLFGSSRLHFGGRWSRATYVALAPGLPVLLLWRMTRRALQGAARPGRFLRALPHLVLLVLAWSWGEWLGYLTDRPPRDLTAAPERTWNRA